MSKPQGKNIIWIIFSVFIVGCFLAVSKAQAADLNTLSDTMSRQAPGIAADHEIKFTTPSGAGAASGYIRISFDGGFDISQILFSDLELWHGPVTGTETQETIAATANSTAWGMARASNHIDLIHPINPANGNIAANDKVIIKIAGTHKIINPVSIGSKIMDLGIYDSLNNVIDSGRLAVPIAIDQVGVNCSATTLPNPVILNFPYNISQTTMDLSWSQNLDCNFDRYELYMATSPGVTNLNGTLLLSVNNSTQTIFNLSGLVSGRTYYFIVYVYNTLGNSAPSNEVSGTTLSGGHIIPPPPAPPSINFRACPIFISPFNINGTKPSQTTIFINGSSDGVTYPDDLSWDKLVNLAVGSNLFLINAQDLYGQNSSVLTATVTRCRVGDTNCNGVVDDFDLAGLAAHWATGWCYADFNEDGIVDDFDLSGLAAHWDSVY